MEGDLPEVRVTDRERDLVTELLRGAVREGAITLHEFEERVGDTMAARTHAELDRLTADLPADLRAPPRPVEPSPRPARRWIVGLLSHERTSRRWRADARTKAVAFMGQADVDLAAADLPADLVVDATAIMGQVTITVPPNVEVDLRGFAFMGERDDRSGDVPIGSPVVTVNAYALMGQVEVTRANEGAGRIETAVAGHVENAVERRVETALARREERRSRRSGRGWIAPVVIVGAVGAGLATGLIPPDALAVFGSDVRQVDVAPGQEETFTSVSLFGSVQVVVPFDADVDMSGLALFGSADCPTCSTTDAEGARIQVRHLTLFGSLEVIRGDEPR